MAMAIGEDDAPKKKKVHEIGEDLAALSLHELADRIALLRDEIVAHRGGGRRQTGERRRCGDLFQEVTEGVRKFPIWNGLARPCADSSPNVGRPLTIP